MAHRKSKKNSGFKAKLFFLLLLLIAGAGYYGYTHRAEVEQKERETVAEVQERISSATDKPAISEPTVSAPQKQTQQPVISVKSKYDNLSYGVPGRTDSIIDREGYSLGYIEYHEQPAWVTYKLTRTRL